MAEGAEVAHRPGHGVTVSVMFRALHREPDLLPRLAQVADLTPKALAKVAAFTTGE